VKKEPEASVSNTNPNDPFTAEVANENRSPLRASRTTTFPRAGTNVVLTVRILKQSLARVGASAHENEVRRYHAAALTSRRLARRPCIRPSQRARCSVAVRNSTPKTMVAIDSRVASIDVGSGEAPQI